MNHTLTFDERERTAFAAGDTYTADLIRDAQFAALDEVGDEHVDELEKARLHGYEQGVDATTPKDVALKVKLLERELTELKRHYKTARSTLRVVTGHLKGDQCKTIKGRAELHRQLSQVIINLPKETP